MILEDAIIVFAFADAPEPLRKACCLNGGDEDYLAILPPSWYDQEPTWLSSGSSFGCCCVDVYEVSERGEMFYHGEDYGGGEPMTGQHIEGNFLEWANCTIRVGCHS